MIKIQSIDTTGYSGFPLAKNLVLKRVTGLNWSINPTIINYFLKMTGMLWVSWPKASSKVEMNLSRDYIGKFLSENDFVDVKVCAVD